MFHRIKIFVSLIFMVDLPHKNILPTKIFRITVYPTNDNEKNVFDCSNLMIIVNRNLHTLHVHAAQFTLPATILVATPTDRQGSAISKFCRFIVPF